MNPLDDIFKKETAPSIQKIEERRLRIVFEWIMSFSVLFWSITIVSHFGSNITLLLKSILLIGITTIVFSAILSLILALFEYKNFSYYTRFYHLWLLLMSIINGITIFISLYMIL